MEAQSCEDELTLRDLYLIFKRKQRLFWKVFGGVLLLGVLVAWFLPRSYTARSVYAYREVSDGLASVSHAGQNAPAAGLKLIIHAPPDALVEGLKAALQSSDLPEAERRAVRVRWDAKGKKLLLEAQALRPKEAEARARHVARLADAYFQKAVTRLLRARLGQLKTELSAEIRAERARLDAAEAAVKDLRSSGAERFRTPAAQGGYENLLVEIATLRVQLADLKARLAYVNELLEREEALAQVAGHFAPFVRVADPYRPQEPSGPGWAMVLALSAFLGLVLAVTAVFVAAALEPPEG